MKKSIYNTVHAISGQSVLYNIRTDKLCIMDPVLAKLWQSAEPDEIMEKHPEFYAYLVDNRFVVDEGLDEASVLIDDWKDDDTNDAVFSLTVNPTLNCNFSCWYCYENHVGNLTMTDIILRATINLATKKICSPNLKTFNLSFFGGEPLLFFDKIIIPIIDCISDACYLHNKSLTISFVTNAYLLSDRMLEALHAYNCPISFQITLDGDETTHNNVRKTKDGGETYSRIMANCKKILCYPSMYLILRCNFTAQNINTFMNVVTSCKAIFHDVPFASHLTFDFHRIWQDARDQRSNSAEVSEREQVVKALFQRAGFNVSVNKTINRYRCYADRNNHAVVNYDGNVFRCTARDFSVENAEGRLSADGKIIWNDKSLRRDAIKWVNTACIKCYIYPLCGGNCSQSKLEASSHDRCYHNYTEEEKASIVLQRVKWLIEKAK